MHRLLRSLRDDRTGVTSIEYAIIAGFLSILIVGSVTTIGATLSGLFASVAAGF